MTSMTTHTSPRSSSRLLAAIALAIAVLAAPAARADIAPACDSLSALITCAATDVGKPCQGGGKCFEMTCSSTAAGGGSMKLYKCDACPTIIETPAGTCGISNMGTSCGDGDGGTGTCGAIAPHCVTATSGKYPCHKPATETPTGPPTSGTIGSAGSGGGGCDVAPRATPSAIGVGLVVLGFIFVVVERVRIRRRR
jgi:hypothetical protein